ncbi:SDR family oxidoreductase [Pragia fontium]|uniref:NAD(P)-dependent dehydrogenase, short-chain alcohol dehydrogenase family n=2 Tax=Pragia fontium TaxID=82985 RepID=A0AAJ4WC64_9GAMM|nr:SDR family oxidoreductase [Pragia fontium]GKX63648.1 3-ketoacyl-ACP reductase [Pragia fontium]SFD15914.1 NAD(P)-dependent dehydrogenase, short-chain alcohol dehydrogenase family [Pragia fontium DSM 5563 = ATCC 49100]SUB80955.1 Pyridoxal 4-dehydrogenase [Pragia fontium]VEJ52768.1 Pyridoxal 4-dehydrogenase [Pragia fontium]
MNTLLKGQRVVVTGAARGLGKSFAASIAQAGASVVMCDVLEQELMASADELKQTGATVEALTIDLSSPTSIEHTFKQIAKGGSIDGLVNNAAMATGVGGKTMMEYDIDLWDRVMSVNVRGTWLVSQAAVPLLKPNGHGKIVNVASDTALWGAPRLMAYVASKGAIISMTRSMARELGVDGICVNAIAPGLTRVEATEYVPAERHQLYEQGRALPGAQHPDDVTGSVLYLLSPLANFVTGQLIPINGGFVFN